MKTMFTSIFMLVFISVIILTLNRKSQDVLSYKMIANVEALTQNELPSGWIKGSEMGDVKVQSGGSAGLVFDISLSFGTNGVSVAPGIGFNVSESYTIIHCCVASDPRNACNADGNDSNCDYEIL